MTTTPAEPPGQPGRLRRAAQVIIIGSVMFTFISYWRTAAIVLCDLASTAYYIGGIVEQSIGPAAPWFILAVMLFSYAVRSVYIESCSLFVRGGVYRVVKEAMGGFLAKLSVSALMFDYILTGPTSSVSAGAYVMGLVFDTIKVFSPDTFTTLGLDVTDTYKYYQRWGAVLIAVAITLYFFRQNIIGIHESSHRALQIMVLTTAMAVIVLLWCGLTLLVRGPVNSVPWKPELGRKVENQTIMGPDRAHDPDGKGPKIEQYKRDPATGKMVPEFLLEVEIDPNTGTPVIDKETGNPVLVYDKDPTGKVKLDAEGKPIPKFKLDPQGNKIPKPKVNEATGQQEDPLGWISSLFPNLARQLRDPTSWFSIIGLIGLMIGFGHSILAMSGEETLAQVYREVESPKLPNFKKAAFIVFVYSLGLTASISFLAVLLIPDEVRMKLYSENLIGGLAMYVIGPGWARLCLNALVTVVGALILAGAVNTAIIGSNGVLNRVSEDGVMPDWFLKPHPKYGTTYRILWLIVALQLFTIIASQGNMYFLGEAYAFGVVWSFVFKALAMVVLRFKEPGPREYKVPLNIHWGRYEIPIGLTLIFLVLLATAILNFFTKEVATIGGVIFTLIFLVIFMTSEHYHEKARRGAHHEHLEQFNQQSTDEVTPATLQLSKPYRKLVAIRSTQNLYMLERTLAETDPTTTDVIVMTAKVAQPLTSSVESKELDSYDQKLMTAVVDRAERAGKEVKPLIVPTNNPLFAVIHTAKDLQAQEMVMGASNKYTADEQLEQIAFYWINMHNGEPPPLTIRILGRERDLYLDLAGGNRIPRISERKARSVAELRAAGVGVDRVLLVYDGSPAGSDLFQAVLTMLDPQVTLGVVPIVPPGTEPFNGHHLVKQDQERAKQLNREVQLIQVAGEPGSEVVRLAREGQYDVVIVSLPPETPAGSTLPLPEWINHIFRNAHSRVFLTAPPGIPHEVVDTSSP